MFLIVFPKLSKHIFLSIYLLFYSIDLQEINVQPLDYIPLKGVTVSKCILRLLYGLFLFVCLDSVY